MKSPIPYSKIETSKQLIVSGNMNRFINVLQCWLNERLVTRRLRKEFPTLYSFAVKTLTLIALQRF